MRIYWISIFLHPPYSYTCTCCSCDPGSTWYTRQNWALLKLLVGKQIHESSCLCSWFHSLVLVYINLNDHYNWIWHEQIPFSSAKDTCIVHKSLSIEIQCSKAFSAKQLIITFHRINACSVRIITVVKLIAVVRLSLHNSILGKWLNWKNKTQSQFMTRTAFYRKNLKLN